MAVNVTMDYNKNTKVKEPLKTGGLALIASGEIVGNTDSDTLELAAGRTYVYFVSVRTTSTGAFYGHAMVLINTPGDDLFGSTAPSYTTIGSSSNVGSSTTYNKDGTITITSASSTRTVSYAIYRLV